jgi:hypothetical protein
LSCVKGVPGCCAEVDGEDEVWRPSDGDSRGLGSVVECPGSNGDDMDVAGEESGLAINGERGSYESPMKMDLTHHHLGVLWWFGEAKMLCQGLLASLQLDETFDTGGR